ncbi:MAG: PdaC/SigV domain-containing protein [Oliverpabstia sp.]
MRYRKKTGLTLGICAGVLAIVAVGVGTGVVVKMFGEKDETREETYVPEEMESQPEQQDTEISPEKPLSYTSEMIQAGDYVTVEYPVFSGGEYQEAVQRLNERVKSEAERIALEQETEMNSFLAEAEEMDMDISVSFERSLKNVYIEGSMIYVEQFDYSYTGGAHGLAALTGINYDLKAERELSMEEVLGCSEESAVEAAAQAFSRTELVQEGIITLDQVRENLDEAAYCMTEEGLHIVFPQYSLGAYAIGMPEAVVTEQDVKDAQG